MKLLIACDDASDLQVMVDDLQRAGLGSVSAAVAPRAPCSVAVVRA
jgi:hypothetical protein